MKNLLKSILVGVLIGNTALAGLPPPTIKGQSDAAAKTKFGIQVPLNQMTDLGGVNALIETGNKNVLKNASFEHSTYSNSWTITTATGAVETSTIVDGKKSAKLTFTASAGDISQSVTPVVNTANQNWEASCKVNTSLTNIQVCALANGVEQICQSVAPNGVWSAGPVAANFQGPANGTSVGVKVKATSSTTGVVYVDDCYVGPARNLSQVSQAQLLGGVTITGCSTAWTGIGTGAWGNFSTQAGCTYTTFGQALAPATNLPALKFSSIPAGEIFITYEGRIGAGLTGDNNFVRFSDGTNASREQSAVISASASIASGTVAYTNHVEGSIAYTNPQSNVQFNLQGFASNASNSSPIVYGTTSIPGVIKVYLFPSQSQLAVSSTQQWQPTVTKLLSGSGTYTTPANVSRIEVEMVGGGGGGAASTTNNGSAGGNTTFGTSLLVANGGGGGITGAGAGGTGGTASVAAPAIQLVALQGASGGEGSAETAAYGATGGVSPFGGAGSGPSGNAIVNSGSGGGGGASSPNGGAGGGAGGYVHAYINYPSATYSYAVGALGGGGAAGASPGGAGGSGAIIVTEYYNTMNAPLLVGQSSGSSVVNVVGMNSTWQHAPSTDSDSNFEQGLGSWQAFSDGGTTLPVSMTGGSPSVTIANTSVAGELLNGLQSAKVVKPASNVQGQGVAAQSVYIPTAYRGSTLTLTGAIKILSGSLVQGDLKIFAYDVTNSKVITPFNNDVIANGQFLATFPVDTTTAQIRVGFYFASTSATALTYAFDDFSISPQGPPLGMAGSDWKNDLTWTPSPGFGTTTSNNFWYRRVGDTIQVKGNFTGGTTAASVAYIQLPSGLTIDSTKFSSATNLQKIGFGHEVSSGSTAIASGTLSILFYDGSTTDRVFIANGAITTQFTKTNGVNIINTSEVYAFEFSVPISGWSSNVTMAQSSTFKISSYLANGTRVTSTPTTLGTYRSYQKTSSAITGTDAAPSVIPNATDGIRIDSIAYGSAGASGQQRFEVFVGKNKNVKFVSYASTGNTGFIDIGIVAPDSSNYVGLNTSYDPTTGVAIIDSLTQLTTTTGRYVGRSFPTAGGAQSVVTTCYVDIIVSENALAVGIQSPRSEVYLVGNSGYGSTNTAVRNYSNILTQNGTALTATLSATLGAFVTINEDGIFDVSASDRAGAGNTTATQFYLEKNSIATPTTSTTDSNTLDMARATYVSGVSFGSKLHATTLLRAGDVIRVTTTNTAGTGVDLAQECNLRITKVAN